jgi:hypothetical protein
MRPAFRSDNAGRDRMIIQDRIAVSICWVTSSILHRCRIADFG